MKWTSLRLRPCLPWRVESIKISSKNRPGTEEHVVKSWRLQDGKRVNIFLSKVKDDLSYLLRLIDIRKGHWHLLVYNLQDETYKSRPIWFSRLPVWDCGWRAQKQVTYLLCSDLAISLCRSWLSDLTHCGKLLFTRLFRLCGHKEHPRILSVA